MEPEFLELFSNTGYLTIQARFKQSGISITDQKLKPGEIQNLVSADGKSFITEMRFDDHLGRIEKIDIFPSKNRIALHVRLHSNPADISA